jgi:signal transduction histidine kinase/ligand-binding sensor domain-containing protein/DNA-binding response OmpR family regulator
VGILSALGIPATALDAAGQEATILTADGRVPVQYVQTTWTVEHGLPVNSINALLQTQDGYLWAATFDGLVRFDGVRFRVYNTGNSAGLPSNRILDPTEASDGSLWLRTEQNHLVRFRDGAFAHFQEDHGLRDNTTRVIYEDPDGKVWVGTEQGLGAIRGDRFVAIAEGTISTTVSAILRGPDGILWIGTQGAGLFRFSNGTASAVATGSGPAALRINTVYTDQAGTLWVGTTEGAYRYRDGKLEPVLTDGADPLGWVYMFLSAPSSGAVWIRTTVGVYRVDDGRPVLVTNQQQTFDRPHLLRSDAEGHVWYPAGTGIYHEGELVYDLGSPQSEGPPVREIRAFLHDHEGSLWVGTGAGGLHRLKPATFLVYSEAEGVGYRNIYSIHEDRYGALWFGTWGRGLSRLAGGTISNFTPDQGFPGLVLSLLEDRRGQLWVGVYNGGAVACSLPEPSCSRLFGGLSVFAMHEDQKGTLWFGTASGLFQADDEVRRLSEEEGAPASPVRVFQPTRDGALWMGTNGGGLYRYQDGGFTQIQAADGFPSDLIRSLYQDADGWLWIGTEGRGLARIDPSSWSPANPHGSLLNSLAVYRASDGLFDEVIHQILEDDFGRLWMSTNRGIFWVNRAELIAFADGETERIHSMSYTERAGLRNREANGGAQPAGIKAKDGRLWFPTQDGAVVVDPARLHRNEMAPPIVIERIIVGDRVIRPERETVELEPDERDLQIEYTGLSFVAPENMRFRYRLEGFNADWVEAEGRRTAFYTNLPPGRYVFWATASNNDGVWNLPGAAVSLRVRPYFHETWAYYALLLVTIGLVAFGAVWWRLRGLRTRQRELSRLVEARTKQLRENEEQLEKQNAQLVDQASKLTELDRAKSRFFANVSHEFRTPLTLTIGPLEDLRSGLYGGLEPESSRQLEMALRNARRLQRLVNQVLDAAKLEAGEMRVQARQADLISFLREIAEVFAPLAERRLIDLRFEAPPQPIWVWFDSSALEGVFANLLSNAFKFTPEGGEITVEISLEPEEEEDGYAVVRVIDSGAGISPEDLPHVFERFYQVSESHGRLQAGTGIGLSLAKDYVELHGGRIRAESKTEGGTTFTVELPLGRAHLSDNEVVDTPEPLPQASALGAGGRATPDEAEHRLVAFETVAAIDTADLALRDANAATPRSTGGSNLIRRATGNDSQDVTTVLVVDDNPDVRAYVRSHLEASYRVAEAVDGEQGISLARELLPDLVISDVMMPGTDGYQLCRELRASPETDFIPVVLLTAKAETEYKVVGLEKGADDYIVKPFEMPELEARVANLIASRRRLRDRFAGKRIELHAENVDISSADARYLQRIRWIIEEHLSDETFGVTELSDRVNQDRSHLYRRIRSLLGETPTDLIRRLRLERAAQLLAGQAGSVAEIAYAVGFRGVSYFCKCFRDAYGVTPSAYRKDPPTGPSTAARVTL